MRVGILGAGSMGQGHGGHLKKISGVEIVAICDESSEHRTALGKKLNVPPQALFGDFD